MAELIITSFLHFLVWLKPLNSIQEHLWILNGAGAATWSYITHEIKVFVVQSKPRKEETKLHQGRKYWACFLCVFVCVTFIPCFIPYCPKTCFFFFAFCLLEASHYELNGWEHINLCLNVFVLKMYCFKIDKDSWTDHSTQILSSSSDPWDSTWTLQLLTWLRLYDRSWWTLLLETHGLFYTLQLDSDSLLGTLDSTRPSLMETISLYCTVDLFWTRFTDSTLDSMAWDGGVCLDTTVRDWGLLKPWTLL